MKSILGFLIVLFTLFSCSQASRSGKSSSVYINNADYDFGMVSDTVRILKHRFTLYNIADDTCHIVKIEKSCGCTKAYCHNQSIAPDDSTAIDIEIDMGSSLFFEKSINIYTSIADVPLTIFVRAAKELSQSSIMQLFPYRVSEEIRLSLNCAIMGFVEHGKQTDKFINVINTSDREVKIEGVFQDRLPFVSVDCPSKLAPKEISRIVFTYDMSHISSVWGEQNCIYELRANGEEYVPIHVYGIITEHFNKSAESAPRISMPITYSRLSSDDIGEPMIRKSFEINNAGTAKLVIRDVQVQKGIKCRLSEKTILPQARGSLELLIPQEMCENHQIIDIGITTNDPKEPYKVISVKSL